MITVNGLDKNYLINGEVCTALKNINFTVKPGEIYGVIGRSGAGKSTLIRCLNLLEHPSSGDVMIDGQSMTKLNTQALRKARRQIGMIFQHFNLLSNRTVSQNIALPLELMGLPRAQITQRVAELTAIVGLKPLANALPASLSGGQKQRVAIARALAPGPKVLLCDEATSALDPETTQTILALLREINQRLKLTIVLITHEMDVVKAICDRVAVIEQGEIVEEAPIIELFAKPKSHVAKVLTQTAMHTDLPAVISKALTQQPKPGWVPIVRLAFVGAKAGEPFVASLQVEFGVKTNVLEAKLELIHGLQVGIMVCQLLGGAEVVLKAIQYLEKKQIQVEVLGYVKADAFTAT